VPPLPVENARTLEIVEEFGVDFAQGFHVGRSAPIEMRPPLVVR
jgi:EAL domain-containing protein (putative c-di-GMP-specific phosphodiesterase class I)